MCGRFAQVNVIKKTGDIVKSIIGESSDSENYNISPGQKVFTIKKYTNGMAISKIKWSIFPYWAKDKKGFKALHNTRIESLQKPYFKKIVNKNRLLIPCNYYYEWSKENINNKTPYCFKLADQDIMFLAGLFENDEFSILTQDSSSDIQTIHHRQPVIIQKNLINDYLDLNLDIKDILRSMKVPSLKYWKIKNDINNPKNNFKGLINSL